MRYKMTLSYRGAGFCGWQIQDNAPSVQGALEDALGMLLRRATQVVGAGRTDTGVNAVGYVAHFDSDTPVDTDFICGKLNAILPKGIVIHSIEAVSDEFHARFSATSRQYRYYIHNVKNPYLEDFSWYCRFDLDTEKMNRACAYLPGTHDCSCFEKKGSDNATSICDIRFARWEKIPLESSPFPFMVPVTPKSPSDVNEGSVLMFTIEANRFLRNMVRAIVGTLVDIGRGRHEPEYILELFNSGNRNDAGQSVPGHALFLTGIEF